MDESTRRQIDWIIVIGAIACLIVWGIGRSQRMARLQDQLANGTPDQQIAAAEQLIDGRILADALKDQPRWVQERAVSAVAQIATAQAWYQLLAAWYLFDAPVQARATELLTNAGTTAIPTLVEALRDKDANTRKGVNPVLVAIGEPVIPYLLPLMDAWDDYVRAGVSAVLGGIGEPAIDEVIAVVKKTAPGADQDSEEYLRERAAAQAALKIMKATAFDAIVKHLLTDPNTDTRGIGVTLLGAIADQSLAGPIPPEEAVRVLPPLLDRLQNDKSYAVRRKAALALGLLGAVGRDNGAGAPLITSLQNPGENPDVRAAAAEALGKLADPAAAGPLVEVLINSRQGIADELVRALERIGPAAVPALAQAVAHPSAEVELLAVRALSNIGGPKPVVSLATALATAAAPTVRRAAAEALRACAAGDLSTHVGAIVGPLTEALSDSDWHVYYAARDALSKCGPAVVPALVPVLGGSHVRAAHMAQQALVHVGKPAISALIGGLKQADTNARLARWAAIALGELGHEAVKPISRVLEDATQPTAVREAAIVALGRTRSKAALPVLQQAYSGCQPLVAEAILEAVGKIGSEDGVKLLLDGLEAASPAVRDTAMETLNEWRLGKPEEELKQLLQAPDKDLQYRAAAVLVLGVSARTDVASFIEMGGIREVQLASDVRDKVGALLSAAAADTSATPTVRHCAIEALGQMGYSEGLAVLGELLKSGGQYAADAGQSVAWIGIKAAEAAPEEETGQLTEAGKLLIGLLTDPDSADSIRVQAAVALAMMRTGPIAAIIEQLEDAPDAIKPWLAATLGAAGKYATEAVYQAYQRARDAEYRVWLAVTMQCIADDKSLKTLKQIPEQEQPDAAKSAAALALTERIRLQKK